MKNKTSILILHCTIHITIASSHFNRAVKFVVLVTVRGWWVYMHGMDILHGMDVLHEVEINSVGRS
jgi:hypothetical protein